MKPPRESEISTRSLATQSRTTVKLRSKVRCQELIRMGAMEEHGEIPVKYKAIETPASFIAQGNTASPISLSLGGFV